MSRQPEPWGGELIVSRWLRRIRKGRVADHTLEREQELHDHREPPAGKSDPYKAARDMLGAEAIFLPHNKRK